ncbi:MAG: ThiF family adenylyltransferase [Nitrosomonas sp.]|nr:ThiF family adenylyltransferase [Nitrosomonas sp.]
MKFKSFKRQGTAYSKEANTSMGLVLRLLKRNWDSARDSVLHADGKERIVYFLGNKTKKSIFLSRVIYVPDEAYVTRNGTYVQIKKEWVGENVFRVALENEYDVVADMHSHPFGQGGVCFSSVDDKSDYAKLPHINQTLTTESSKYGVQRSFTGIALVTDHSSFDGRILQSNTNSFQSIDKVILIDKSTTITLNPTSTKEQKRKQESAVFSKQLLVFGSEGQKKISRSKIVLCGAGGIGSIVAESLMRLGIESLTIIDDDKLEESNLHRWQGGTPKDLGKFKAVVLKEKLTAAFPKTNITGINETIYSTKSVDALKLADIIIGAVDNNIARIFISRLAAQYAIPYLDGAAQIVKSPMTEASAQYKTCFYIPGSTACFDCSPLPLYDRQQVAMNYVDPITYQWVRAKGYLDDAPNERMVTVYGINLIVAGMMTLQLQNFLVDNYGVWYYRSNASEFESGFTIKHGLENSEVSEMLPTQSIPIGHALSIPNDECPFCVGRRAGLCDGVDLIYPAAAKKSVHFPNAKLFYCDEQ